MSKISKLILTPHLQLVLSRTVSLNSLLIDALMPITFNRFLYQFQMLLMPNGQEKSSSYISRRHVCDAEFHRILSHICWSKSCIK